MSRSTMKTIFKNATQSALVLGIAAAMILPAYASTSTGSPNPLEATSQKQTVRMADQIRSKLLTLPTYGVFDYLTFNIQGSEVTLDGYASRPILKSDAARAVRSIEGVESVTNKIEVLPLSNFDDQIRLRTYLAIYRNPNLPRYSTGGPMMMPMMSPMWAAGGITNNPPIGWTPIHIIVKNGNVTLTGFVGRSMDKQIIGMAVNRIPGVFAVNNDLSVVTTS